LGTIENIDEFLSPVTSGANLHLEELKYPNK
jgi:hypothetical protein